MVTEKPKCMINFDSKKCLDAHSQISGTVDPNMNMRKSCLDIFLVFLTQIITLQQTLTILLCNYSHPVKVYSQYISQLACKHTPA